MGVLAEARHAAADPLSGPVHQLASGTLGGPNSRVAAAVLTSQPSAASTPVKTGAAQSFAERLGQHRMRQVSGPLTLSGPDGTVQWPSARSTMALASPCQITLTWPAVRSIVAVAHLGGDVVQHAVAHVDCVIEPDDAAGVCRVREKYWNMASRATQELA